jgi:hypothetical protein
MRLTPERIAKARVPDPEKRYASILKTRKKGLGRTETPTNTMFETLPKVMDLHRRLTAIPPNHFACFTEMLLIVGEDDEIVKGCYSVPP